LDSILYFYGEIFYSCEWNTVGFFLLALVGYDKGIHFHLYCFGYGGFEPNADYCNRSG